jgi:hypothetical protein
LARFVVAVDACPTPAAAAGVKVRLDLSSLHTERLEQLKFQHRRQNMRMKIAQDAEVTCVGVQDGCRNSDNITQPLRKHII